MIINKSMSTNNDKQKNSVFLVLVIRQEARLVNPHKLNLLYQTKQSRFQLKSILCIAMVTHQRQGK